MFELSSVPDFEDLLPPDYAAYRPLLVDALMFFLSALSPARREAILAEQMALPVGTPAVERLVALLHLCPTLHKLAQVAARDKRLAPEFRAQLQQLESFKPRTTVAEVQNEIAAAVGKTPGVTVGKVGLAEASVALVVPLRWKQRGSSVHGVLKVLKPHVREHLTEELEIWSKLGSYLEAQAAHYGLPELEYRETLESVRDLLLQEIQLEGEQSHLREAALLFRNRADILVPELLPFCTNAVTAMERVYGEKITDAHLAPARLREVARGLIDGLIAAPFWRPDGDALFHADPHAGNVWYSRDGRIALLDWSLAARLCKTTREAVVQTVLGAAALDHHRVACAIGGVATAVPGLAQLRQAALEAVDEVRHGRLPGFTWLVQLLDSVATDGAVRFPQDMFFFRKALLTLDGVASDIAPGVSTDSVLLASALREFVREAGLRPLAEPGSRRFATHISNLDLLRQWTDLPLTARRCWDGAWRDALSLWRR